MEKEQTNIIDEGLFEKIANGDDAALLNCIMHHTDKYMVSSWH